MQNDEHYEDELDRMRVRSSRRRNATSPKPVNDSRTDDEVFGENSDMISERIQVDEPVSRQKGSARMRVKRKKRRRKIFRILILAILIFAGYFFYQWVRDDSYWTIAVFGVDSRNGNLGKGALSDVEMLCSINKKTGEMRLVSVFRDSYLRIDQNDDYDKINEAYFKGGQKQAVDALKDNLDLQIDDYATFNWKAVVDAINVLGGVDLEITDKEFAYINSFITETVESTGVGSVHLEHSGMNHLDGVQSVAYARLRLMDTDFNRTERQRKVLGLAMEKAKKADARMLKNLVSAVYPQVATSIGINDLLGMAKNANKYYIGQTSGFPFSHQEVKVGKKSCVIPTTLESNVVQLHTFLYEKEKYEVSSTVKAISSYIAEKTGLGDPGKDIESGKNVGTEGSSGSGQAAPKPESPNQQTEPVPETSPAETETTAEETTEEPESDTAEGTASEPSTEEETTRSSVVTAPGADQSSVQHTESSKGPGSSSAGQNNASETPAKNAETSAGPHAALEAPGQGNTSSTEEVNGPGVN